jgi:hypothetical protein
MIAHGVSHGKADEVHHRYIPLGKSELKGDEAWQR